MKIRSLVRIVVGIVAILLVPLIAMQVTEEVRWTGADFAAAALLLLLGGVAYELAASRVDTSRGKAIVGVAVAGVVFLIWLQLAAGII